ncbi:aminopeptidase O isoform X2 [Rhinatrema bivittatum]|uniref:aminopeptidase O isoform X2 n=1 Tax=Rhinatrema bivittatum TaxID=194408 RepID=UPI00112BD184|nr:aminopeptidase O isoform X2 [Rhinatrema bivittatum]
MEGKMDPSKDDLPLMANVGYMLVKHYVLDLDVSFENQIISGTIVLFLEMGDKFQKVHRRVREGCCSQPDEGCPARESKACCLPVASLSSSNTGHNDFSASDQGEEDCSQENDHLGYSEQASGISSSKSSCDTEHHGREDFVLVLDCCDLSVIKVEAVDIAAAPGIEKYARSAGLNDASELRNSRNRIVSELVTLSADCWQEKLSCYAQCSQAPGCGELLFATDPWSLQIWKEGVQTPADFPHAVRIWYKTKPGGRSVMWTTDQSNRLCVYTVGSPINNRALFPCQEPPVAMSTWQATVQASDCFVVLMSGENSAEPLACQGGLSSWFYYVTMPMPASTFTIAVGCWEEVKRESSMKGISSFPDNECRLAKRQCSHVAYPCRFNSPVAEVQAIIPHRVFAPLCLRDRCEEMLLPLIPQCLSAAHATLGTHPFPRLDVLIVPSNFSSLGMASPHIIFLSQSVLSGGSDLCGSRLCHEIAHAWFGLAIGARDWTEEWLSEGFATHLEDTFWANAQRLLHEEAKEQKELKALLRWRRLRDEVQNSEEELQVLRPKREKTGELSDSGESVVKHGLNPEKNFMQVHYLKGYFLLRFLANQIGETSYFAFLRKFVQIFHGQLILSQDFLNMLLEDIPEQKGCELSVEAIYHNWLDTSGIPKPLLEESSAWTENRLARQVKDELLPDQLVLLLESLLEEKTLYPRTLLCLENTYRLREQDAEVQHRWCELIVKHKYSTAYGDVEQFLQDHQAMGVYLYGELMVNKDITQQQLARRCFAVIREQMDVSSAKVVGEMLF